MYSSYVALQPSELCEKLKTERRKSDDEEVGGSQEAEEREARMARGLSATLLQQCGAPFVTRSIHPLFTLGSCPAPLRKSGPSFGEGEAALHWPV
jgi:hypothetical protein